MNAEHLDAIRARVPRDGHIDETNRALIARAMPYAQKWNNRAEWVDVVEWLNNLVQDRRALLDALKDRYDQIAVLRSLLREVSGETEGDAETLGDRIRAALWATEPKGMTDDC